MECGNVTRWRRTLKQYQEWAINIATMEIDKGVMEERLKESRWRVEHKKKKNNETRHEVMNWKSRKEK